MGLCMVAVFILAWAELSVLAADMSKCTNMASGCNIPLGMSFPYQKVFLPACVKHEICYRCGSKFRWSRVDCDQAFKNNTIEICMLKDSVQRTKSDQNFLTTMSWKKLRDFLSLIDNHSQWLTYNYGPLEQCLKAADAYAKAVRKFTGSAVDKKTLSLCDQKCAFSLGNPSEGMLH